MKIKTHVKAGTGLGDTVAQVTSATGLDVLAHKFEQVSGCSCGCEERRGKLNELFSYDVPE